MKKKFLLSFVFAFYCTSIVIGQDSLFLDSSPFPKVIITFSPLNLINLRVPATQFGIEYRVANKLSLQHEACLLYTSPSPRDATLSRMPSSA